MFIGVYIKSTKQYWYSTHVEIHYIFDERFQDVNNENDLIRFTKLKLFWQKIVSTNKIKGNKDTFVMLSYFLCELDFNIGFAKSLKAYSSPLALVNKVRT